jgi:subtilisin family serine protease
VLRAALRSPFAASRAFPADPGAPVSCFVEGSVSPAAIEALGGRLGRESGGRQTLRIPRGRLLEAARLPGVTRLRAATRMAPTLDLSAPDIRSPLVHQGLPDAAVGVTGAGAVVGVVDTGIDWMHADFRTPGNTTRIRALWDQNDGLGPSPAGYGYGSEWSAADIDLGACRQRDSTFFAHGTHVAGIAAGSGRATGNGWPDFRYVGVAPNADIMAVNTSFWSTDIADGVAWIFDRAGALGRPAVVNLSLGSDGGPHDGTTDFELFLNGLTGPGRIIVASAGNSHGKGAHGERNVPAVGEGILSFRIFGYTPSPSIDEGVLVDAWYEGGDDLLVTIRSPNGHFVGPVAKGALLAVPTPDGWVSLDHTGIEVLNNNGDVNFVLEVSDAGGLPVATGDWEIRMSRVDAPSGGHVDAWIAGHAFPFPPAFVSGKEEAELLIQPSTADSLISVAAHTTRASWTSINGNGYGYGQTLNQIGTFSSPGPRRDNLLRPDLSAPGTAIGAAHSSTSLPNPTANILPDGVHKALQGTSMSAPQVTGAVALLLSRWPQLTPSAVRAALTSTARTDAFTGVVPNARWGHGKLDLEALFAARLAFAAGVDPNRTTTPGGAVTLVDCGAAPNAGTWPTAYRFRVTDSAGWLHHADGGPAVPVAVYEGTSEEIGPGQQRMAPVSGALSIVAPAMAAEGDSTVVTFEAEPVGVPWMRQALTTVVRVSVLADAGAGVAAPAALALSARADGRGGVRFVVEAPGAGWMTLEVIDVAGRVRARPVDAAVTAGLHEFEWNGREASGRTLGGGIYFLAVRQGDRRVVERLVWHGAGGR